MEMVSSGSCLQLVMTFDRPLHRQAVGAGGKGGRGGGQELPVL